MLNNKLGLRKSTRLGEIYFLITSTGIVTKLWLLILSQVQMCRECSGLHVNVSWRGEMSKTEREIWGKNILTTRIYNISTHNISKTIKYEECSAKLSNRDMPLNLALRYLVTFENLLLCCVYVKTDLKELYIVCMAYLNADCWLQYWLLAVGFYFLCESVKMEPIYKFYNENPDEW